MQNQVIQALQTLLFVPATSERKMEKALASSADAVIIDLEDSVLPDAKSDARRTVRNMLSTSRTRTVAVRVNAMDTPDFVLDLAALAGHLPDIVMLPKCSHRQDLVRLGDQLDLLEEISSVTRGTVKILPLVTETASALGSMDYGGTTGRLAGLGFAGEDLAADIGISARDRDGMHPILAAARRNVVIAATAAGVAAIDTPYPDTADLAGLKAEASEGARLGFTGKMCIHPAQLEPVAAAFQPGADKVEWARKVTAAFAGGAAQGAVLLDGKMIDRAHLRLAERYLSRNRTDLNKASDEG
nr:CoA ester lyase [Hyphomonas sp. ND6WE1B]